MWAWIGVGLAALGALLGLRNARAPRLDAFAASEYAMTARSHARFAALSALFAAAFVAAAWQPAVPTLPLLAIYVLLFVLYAASFARGFSDP
jgi:uncharacterized membrane protein